MCKKEKCPLQRKHSRKLSENSAKKTPFLQGKKGKQGRGQGIRGLGLGGRLAKKVGGRGEETPQKGKKNADPEVVPTDTRASQRRQCAKPRQRTIPQQKPQ